MSLVPTTPIDYSGLPQELLPTVKQHCRIDHKLDDLYLLNTIARAIQQFEIKTETKVFPATYTWTPSGTAYCNGGWLSPISPIISWKAFVNAVDVSADYQFTTAETIYGTGQYYLHGANQSGLAIQQLKTGYLDACLMPPGILDRILTLAATYYENRELFIPAGQFLNPLGREADMAGWWIPKA